MILWLYGRGYKFQKGLFMSTTTIDPAADKVGAVEIVKVNKLMTAAEAQELEKRQALETHYYSIFLHEEATGTAVRVRTPCWQVDGEFNFVLDENGNRKRLNTHDVALNVWAAYGADDYSLIHGTLGPVVTSTPETIMNEIVMRKDIPHSEISE